MGQFCYVMLWNLLLENKNKEHSHFVKKFLCSKNPRNLIFERITASNLSFFISKCCNDKHISLKNNDQ